MKKLIPLITMLIALVATASAFPNGRSGLEISVEEYGRFTIEVNGHPYHTKTGILRLNDVAPGEYEVRVVKHEKPRHRHGGAYRSRMLYQGIVFVPHQTVVQGRFNRFGMRYREIGTVPSQICVSPEPIHASGVRIMHPNVFENLLSSIRSTPFDRSRIQIVRTALRNNFVTTRQVARLMREISFDSRRLELSKLAFRSCIDPENYITLTQEFTFDSNARALMRFIH